MTHLTVAGQYDTVTTVQGVTWHPSGQYGAEVPIEILHNSITQ